MADQFLLLQAGFVTWIGPWITFYCGIAIAATFIRLVAGYFWTRAMRVIIVNRSQADEI